MGGARFIFHVAALGLCALPAAVRAADEPLQMAPASNWVMDYAEDSCALRRAFEGGGNRAYLELRQFGPGEQFQVTLGSDTLSRTSRTPRTRFEPDDGLTERLPAYFFDRDGMHGVLYTDSLRPTALDLSPGRTGRFPDWPAAEREARERSVTGLTVIGSFERSISLSTGEMHQPMEAMRKCLDELLAHWGLDAAVQRTLSRPARPVDQMAWARRVQASYPMDLLRAGRSGVVNIRLVVGADGKPSSCISNKDAPDSAFEKHACEATMRHARFEPALDINGVPVASYFTTTISYQVSR